MKIENNYTNYEVEKMSPRAGQPAVGPGESLQTAKNSPENEGPSSIQDAVVNLSQASKEALLIDTTISNAPDVRDEKVLALKEKIMAGQYEINPQAIAEKMVDHFAEDFLTL